MKKSLIVAFVLITGLLKAQTGNDFPSIGGNTLDERTLMIPKDTKGKYTLIGMAYSKAAEQELQTWFQPVYSTFLEKTKPGLFNQSYDVNLYFIPMFTGANQAASGAATKKLKQGLDKSLQPHVLVYKGDLKTYKDQLDFEKKDTPYFFILDKEGIIVYTTSGKFTEEKMAKIEELIGGEGE